MSYSYVVEQDSDKEFRVVLLADNGRRMFDSCESYTTKRSADRAGKSAVKGISNE